MMTTQAGEIMSVFLKEHRIIPLGTHVKVPRIQPCWALYSKLPCDEREVPRPAGLVCSAAVYNTVHRIILPFYEYSYFKTY
jgi:hypothetical protein